MTPLRNIPERTIVRLGRPETFHMASLAHFAKLSVHYSEAEFRAIAEKIRSRELTPKGQNIIKSNRLAPTTEEDFKPIQSEEYTELREQGSKIYRGGEIGAIILAGGVSARLDENKIFMSISKNYKTLLALKLWATIGRAKDRDKVSVPLFILTSPATEAEVRRIMEEAGYKEGVHYMMHNQSLLPVLSPDGELINFRDRDHVLYSTTGHGDVFATMKKAHAIEWMMKLGVRHIVQSNIDNPLVSIDDDRANTFLAYIAHHVRTGKAVTAQVTRKTPDFKGGVPLKFQWSEGNWRTAIIEASQIDESFLESFSSQLPYANPLTMIYDADFLSQFQPSLLPRVIVERADKDKETGDAMEYRKLETMSGSITMVQETTFVPDVIAGIPNAAMFTQVKDEKQKAAFIDSIISQFPELRF